MDKNLKKRIVSGAVLSVAALLMTLSAFTFGLLCIGIAAFALFEWYGMVNGEKNQRPYALMSLVIIVFPMLMSSHLSFAVGLLGLILMGGTFFLFLLLNHTRRKAFIIALAIPYVGIPMNSLAWIRSDYESGLTLIIYILLCAWLSDSFAYFVGKRLKGPKLAPKISPNKTWSGLGGACFGGFLAGVIVLYSTQSSDAKEIVVYQNLFDLDFIWIALFSSMMGVVGQVGDLLESFVKRFYNVKDSGSVIPGHGGVLDRIDALLAISFAVALLHYFKEFISVASIG